ncbi:YIP1 family protein [Sedimentitalea sp. CY04]|uniref:YIP1 family protein n=1 Tax=Parasedimentitalea denitrificans TaxID=2211118 RepID=A0ABX0WEM3_9RHOB|nr:YIP1 family protein [Sedimentitalea sp. CY04]NIZ62760.1 YIP1 family protein [Sedimentitalea sp. CY04]
MPLTTDIVATYKGPRRVIARLLAMGPREDRALAILMGGCALAFIAQMPKLAREAYITGQELNMLLGGALFGLIFIAPLILYTLSLVSFVVVRVLGGKGDSYGARLALFWALLAASPLMLLNGLAGGFIGPGPELTLVGGIWFALFLWFWISGLFEAYWKSK